MESKPIHLSVKSHPENLSHIREVVTQMASKSQLPEKDLGSIILAVDEACSNIIRHSYKNDHTQDINLRLQLSKKKLIIIITDTGIEFDINTIEARDVTDVKPGGLGLYIIKEIMDGLEYTRTPDGCNQIKMVKKL